MNEKVSFFSFYVHLGHSLNAAEDEKYKYFLEPASFCVFIPSLHLLLKGEKTKEKRKKEEFRYFQRPVAISNLSPFFVTIL